MRIGYVYALSDPTTEVPRYIGKSVRPFKRLNQHICDARRNHHNRGFSKWMQSINCSPALIVLKACRIELMNYYERQFIREMRAKGIAIFNILDGGQGAPLMSLKGRRKNLTPAGRERLRRLGMLAYEEGRLKLGPKWRAANAAWWAQFTPEQRSQMATERNKKAWAKRTADDRKAIGRNIRKGIEAVYTREEIRARAIKASQAAAAMPNCSEHCSKVVKSWWASLTPEARAEFVARRAKTIREAKLRKRKAIQPQMFD